MLQDLPQFTTKAVREVASSGQLQRAMRGDSLLATQELIATSSPQLGIPRTAETDINP